MHGANDAQSDPHSDPGPSGSNGWRLAAWDTLFATAPAAARPALEALRGESIPEPYRSLLVHNGDMTPTLEQFHRGGIYLQVLHAQQAAEQYQRHVVLRMEGSTKPVEFGAIEIDLSVFELAARHVILEGKRPLGAILREFKIAHLSRPKAYFWLNSDAVINASLQLNGSHKLYGRRNTLLLPDGRTLAEIVEILPP